MATATIEIPFAVGQELWWIGNGHRTETIVCPDCAGSRAITMILGNGDQVSLECRCCQLGYDQPRGVVERTYFGHEPIRFIPKRVSCEGDRIYYSKSVGACSRVHSSELYATESECQQRCDELNNTATEAELVRSMHVRESKRRDMAWSASYWRGQVKDLEQKLERARARLAVCKVKNAEPIPSL